MFYSTWWENKIEWVTFGGMHCICMVLLEERMQISRKAKETYCGVVTSKARQTHSSVFYGRVIFSNPSSTHNTDKAKRKIKKKKL